MQTYLGVTTEQETEKLELCCASASDAQVLATDLSNTFQLFDNDQPEVTDYKIIYRGNVRLLKQFLTSRQWQLIMDTTSRLIFERPVQD